MDKKRFAALGIPGELTDALQAMGIVQPTPVQNQAIPLLLSGKDVIAQAQTGTGKTLAFLLPILTRIDVQQRAVQALIITPTRELAIQITDEAKKLAPLVGANVLAAYGGQDVERQIRKLEGTIHLVVGTPGRLLDHLRRGTVHFGKIDFLVLDEADQMLHMGFLKEVQEIIDQTSSRRQTLLFSATMPGPIRNLAKNYMKNPVEVEIETKKVTLEEIKQLVIKTTDRGKQQALIDALIEFRPYLSMVFCRTKRRASVLNEALLECGILSDELHGDLSQAKREQVMKRFREGKIHVLVATDMAARGIDVEGITHVFNYDIPHDAESYIHRIGRTGRAGQTGMAVTFAAPKDMYSLELIEKGIRQTLKKRDGGAGNDRDAVVADSQGRRKESGARPKGRSDAKNRRGGEAAGRREAGGRGRGARADERGQRSFEQREGAGRAAQPGERGQRSSERREGAGRAAQPGERGQRSFERREGAGRAAQPGERGQRSFERREGAGRAAQPGERGQRSFERREGAGRAAQPGERGQRSFERREGAGYAAQPGERGQRSFERREGAGRAAQPGERGQQRRDAAPSGGSRTSGSRGPARGGRNTGGRKRTR